MESKNFPKIRDVRQVRYQSWYFRGRKQNGCLSLGRWLARDMLLALFAMLFVYTITTGHIDWSIFFGILTAISFLFSKIGAIIITGIFLPAIQGIPAALSGAVATHFAAKLFKKGSSKIPTNKSEQKPKTKAQLPEPEKSIKMPEIELPDTQPVPLKIKADDIPRKSLRKPPELQN